jgi:hypothetical protein
MSTTRPAGGAEHWRKSSYTGAQGDCVEITDRGDVVGVRDSKHPDGPVLRLPRAEWAVFVEAVKRGEFDRQAAGR